MLNPRGHSLADATYPSPRYTEKGSSPVRAGARVGSTVGQRSVEVRMCVRTSARCAW